MKTKLYTYTLEEIDTIASTLIKKLDSKVVLFNGEMGAGKTTLIRAMVNAMGSDDSVTSPTFSIVNEYAILNNTIYHFDLYRIKDTEEAYNFGIEDYFYSSQWLFIEWSERIASLLPQDVCTIDISIETSTKRTLKLKINSNNFTENNEKQQLA